MPTPDGKEYPPDDGVTENFVEFSEFGYVLISPGFIDGFLTFDELIRAFYKHRKNGFNQTRVRIDCHFNP